MATTITENGIIYAFTFDGALHIHAIYHENYNEWEGIIEADSIKSTSIYNCNQLMNMLNDYAKGSLDVSTTIEFPKDPSNHLEIKFITKVPYCGPLCLTICVDNIGLTPNEKAIKSLEHKLDTMGKSHRVEIDALNQKMAKLEFELMKTKVITREAIIFFIEGDLIDPAELVLLLLGCAGITLEALQWLIIENHLDHDDIMLFLTKRFEKIMLDTFKWLSNNNYINSEDIVKLLTDDNVIKRQDVFIWAWDEKHIDNSFITRILSKQLVLRKKLYWYGNF